MPELVLKDAKVVIDSVDLSAHVRQVTIDYKAEIQDKTAMGDGSRSRIAGLKDWSMSVEFNQDYAAASVDATLFPLVGAAAFSVSVLPVKAEPVSATNPNYNGNAVLESYQPVGGTVGDLAVTSITLSGDGDLIRTTP